jgi:pilus assembly protein CpaE
MGGVGAGFVWVTEDAAASRELLEGAGREFGMTPHFCRAAEVLEVIRSARVDLVGIELGVEPSAGLALLRELHERLPRVTMLAASADPSVTVLRAALDAGAVDVLSLPLGRGEIHKALIKFSQSEVRNAAGRGVGGSVISIYGARGGLGTSTLAVNLATRLMALAGSDTAVVDLDLQRGDVAAFLNLTPLNSIATLAEAKGPVDDIFLAGTLTRHPRGVFVLPAPPQVEEADTVGHDHVELALQLLRSQFRYTVVDTARTVSGPIMAAFEQSDHILVLTDLSVPGVRAARRLIELVIRLGPGLERVHPIFSHVIPGPVSAQDAARAIGKEPFLVMPRDDSTASGAMNGGIPLNGKQSALSHAIAQLASKLAGVAPPRAKGLLQRVFGKEARR